MLVPSGDEAVPVAVCEVVVVRCMVGGVGQSPNIQLDGHQDVTTEGRFLDCSSRSAGIYQRSWYHEPETKDSST